MALRDFLAIIDNGLKEVFDRKAVDPAKARRPLLRGIDRALAAVQVGLERHADRMVPAEERCRRAHGQG